MASRPFLWDGRDAHPTRTIKIVSYLILIPKSITSDGTKHGNPQYYRKYEKKLAKRQKQLSHKLKGSRNRNKARVKVAKVHAKIVRCREDFLHKLSRKLVDENFRHSCRESSS